MRKRSGFYIPYEGNNYSGIFRSYKKVTTSLEKLVKVSASSIAKDGTHDLMYPFTTSESERYSWLSENEPNSCITMKFINYKMSVSSYSLRARYAWPISWDVEALNNAGKWEMMSHITNDRSLEYDATGHWKTTNQNLFDTIRIKQTAKRVIPNDVGDDSFDLRVIEFFGTLVRNEICTLRMKHSINFYITALLLILSI